MSRECLLGNLIPASWRATSRQRTPNGSPAIYRSTPHALMGLRVRYRLEILRESATNIEAAVAEYQSNWDAFVQHAHDMNRLIALCDAGDVDRTVVAWNAINQVAVNAALRVVIGEREVLNGRHSAAQICSTYLSRGPADRQVDPSARDRPLKPSDSNEAWARSEDGRCNGCGTPTISHRQRERLHRTMKSNRDRFDLAPTYIQYNGVVAPLWGGMTLAAKGVAEHVTPRSQGGQTNPGNLTNCCFACNYARGDRSMDTMGTASYDRPPSELSWRG